MEYSYSIKILKFEAASCIKITQPSEQLRKESIVLMACLHLLHLCVKVVGQEQKWVDRTDNDEVKCQHGRVWQSREHGDHAWTDCHVTDEECVHFDKD